MSKFKAPEYSYLHKRYKSVSPLLFSLLSKFSSAGVVLQLRIQKFVLLYDVQSSMLL